MRRSKNKRRIRKWHRKSSPRRIRRMLGSGIRIRLGL